MNTVMENSSVVIIAKDLNLSILKPLWLIKNNIFLEDELKGDIVITPPAIQIPSTNFQFLVLQDRLQLTVHRQYPDAQSDINRILGGIVMKLPHTPYTAIGINFQYLVAPESGNAPDNWEGTLFASPVSNKLEGVEINKARYGSYLSFDILGMRLKIDIKPTNAGSNIEALCNSWHYGQELIRIQFNFHTDVTNTKAPEELVADRLRKWTKAFNLSEELRDKIIKLE